MWHLFWYKNERDMVEDRIFWSDVFEELNDAGRMARDIEGANPGHVVLIIPEGDI